MLIHPEKKVRTVVPVHPGRSIKEPLPSAILRDANLSVDSVHGVALRLERDCDSQNPPIISNSDRI
jgi:hypothetical protein